VRPHTIRHGNTARLPARKVGFRTRKPSSSLYPALPPSSRTPCLQRVYDALPLESRTGRVQLLMPATLKPFLPDEAPPHNGDLGTSAPASGPRLGSLAAAAAERGSDGLAAAAAEGAASSHATSHCQPPMGSAAASRPAPLDAPACVIHLAATGDQTFGRRLRLGFPLLQDVSRRRPGVAGRSGERPQRVGKPGARAVI
jgi:hypothetical protein